MIVWLFVLYIYIYTINIPYPLPISVPLSPQSRKRQAAVLRRLLRLRLSRWGRRGSSPGARLEKQVGKSMGKTNGDGKTMGHS